MWEDGEWIPHHDYHLSTQSHATIFKALLKRPPKIHPQTRLNKQQFSEAQSTWKYPKATSLPWGAGTACYELPKAKNGSPLYTWASSSFHEASWWTLSWTVNFHINFTMNKSCKNAENASHNYHTFLKHLEGSNRRKKQSCNPWTFTDLKWLNEYH